MSLDLIPLYQHFQMNDTMKIWHSVWNCPDDTPKAKHYDMTIVAFSATILAIIVCLFYSGSYIQIEHAQRNLIRCNLPLIISFICKLFRLANSSTAWTAKQTHIFFNCRYRLHFGLISTRRVKNILAIYLNKLIFLHFVYSYGLLPLNTFFLVAILFVTLIQKCCLSGIVS